jgi:hypothetical protein
VEPLSAGTARPAPRSAAVQPARATASKAATVSKSIAAC